MTSRRISLVTPFVLGVLFFVSSSTVAGPILVNCVATNEQFVGFAGHRAILANARHPLGQHFAAMCGNNLWTIHWPIREFQRVQNLADGLLLLKMKARHQVAVPGHAQEVAPNNDDAELQRLMRLATVQFTGWPFMVIGTKVAQHTGHQDTAVGLFMLVSQNKEFLMYVLGLTVLHTVSPLISVGSIIDPNPNESLALTGMIVGEPAAEEMTLAFVVVGTSSIDSAELTIAGSDTSIKLDPTHFKSDDGMASFIDPNFSLNGNNVEALFESGESTLTVNVGDERIKAVIQLRDEIETETPKTDFLPVTQAGRDGDYTTWVPWLALVLSVLALLFVFSRKRG